MSSAYSVLNTVEQSCERLYFTRFKKKKIEHNLFGIYFIEITQLRY